MTSRDPGLGEANSSPPAAKIIQVLKNSALFKGFTDTGLQIMGSIAQEKPVPAGTPLFVENMMGEALFIIAEGLIRVSIRGPQGQDIVLARLGQGESLGEVALLRSGPRQCSALAEVASIVIEISRRDMSALQRTKPQACLKLMMSVVEEVAVRLRDTQSDYCQFVTWRLGIPQ